MVDEIEPALGGTRFRHSLDSGNGPSEGKDSRDSDFPKPGILFYDITTLLCDGQGFRDTVDALAAPYMGEDIDQVIGIESRGFILGAAVANALGCGFVPVRKPGKLPGATHPRGLQPRIRQQRARDSPGRLREQPADPDRRRRARNRRHGEGDRRSGAKAGGKIIGARFLIELDFLNGRSKLAGEPVYSVLRY